MAGVEAMAVAAAHFYGIPLATIRQALFEFKGIKRRQEIVGTVNALLSSMTLGIIQQPFVKHSQACRNVFQAPKFGPCLSLEATLPDVQFFKKCCPKPLLLRLE